MDFSKSSGSAPPGLIILEPIICGKENNENKHFSISYRFPQFIYKINLADNIFSTISHQTFTMNFPFPTYLSSMPFDGFINFLVCTTLLILQHLCNFTKHFRQLCTYFCIVRLVFNFYSHFCISFIIFSNIFVFICETIKKYTNLSQLF